jgi:hypothetical protein
MIKQNYANAEQMHNSVRQMLSMPLGARSTNVTFSYFSRAYYADTWRTLTNCKPSLKKLSPQVSGEKLCLS